MFSHNLHSGIKNAFTFLSVEIGLAQVRFNPILYGVVDFSLDEFHLGADVVFLLHVDGFLFLQEDVLLLTIYMDREVPI